VSTQRLHLLRTLVITAVRFEHTLYHLAEVCPEIVQMIVITSTAECT